MRPSDIPAAVSANRTTRHTALVVTTISGFLTPFMSSSMNIALPSIGREFAASAVHLNWIAAAYTLAAAVFLLPFGRAADIVGRKKVFLYGSIVYALTSLLLAAAGSIGALVLFRILQGIGGAMIFATGVAILTSVFPAEERGRVLGINVASVYLGLSLGPVLGGFLTDQLGWRSIFWLNVPLGLAVVVLILWKMKDEWVEARGQRFDVLGSVLCGSGLVLVMLGFSRLPNLSGFMLLAGGGALLFVFGLWEWRQEHPLLNVRHFRQNVTFAFSNLAALINYSATSAVGFLLSLYLQYIKVLSAQQAGLILVTQPFFQALLSPLAGRLSDRIEPRILASLGMGFSVLGLAALSLLGEGTPMGFIVGCLVALGLGFAFFSSPNTNAVMSSVGRQDYGIASATLGTMRLVGMMFSMGVTMLLFAVYIGPAKICLPNYPQFLASVRVAFVIFALLSCGGIFASLARGKVRE